MGPVATYLAAVGGVLAGTWGFLYLGDRVRGLVRARVRERPPSDGRLRHFVVRYGARGLGLVGPLFPRVTASVVLGIGLGVERAELGRWMTIGIMVLDALHTAGLWIIVAFAG